MNAGPAVVVNKGGFLSALVKGVFATIVVVIICGTGLGLYAMHLADRYGTAFLQFLPEWQRAMPPMVADALNDRRAVEYREHLEIRTRLEPSDRDATDGALIVEVKNVGEEVVSLLNLRVVAEDASSARLCELPISVATPFAFDSHVHRGPLLPGETRRIARRVHEIVGQPKLSHEVTELRVWNGPAAKTEPPRPPSPDSSSRVGLRHSAS